MAKFMGIGVAALVCAQALHGFAAAPAKTDPGPQPTVRLAVEPLGYAPPSTFYLIYRLSSGSLNFIDSDHLLFTFHLNTLMRRLPGDTDGDEDQTIRAVVLQISTGKVVTQVDWRMHDRGQYLWPMGGGRFLIRQRDTLYTTDRTLALKPYLRLTDPIEALKFSPDGKLLLVEVKQPLSERRPGPTAADPVPEIGTRPTRIYLVRAATQKVIATSVTHEPIDMPIVDSGYMEALSARQNNQWLIQYVPVEGTPKQLTNVPSTCQPTQTPLSVEVTLVSGCVGTTGDHVVSAVSMEGKLLWQQTWSSHYIWPTFAMAENGSRFAYGSLLTTHDIGTLDPVNESDIAGQMVGVFDTATGQLKMVKKANPILSAGQNFALSPDGNRFAILNEGSIEVYDLPPAAAAVNPSSVVSPSSVAQKSVAQKK
ncbi:MAG: hypothetical protein HIU87_13450 [Acidobacteria bacterium]|nr:hypothetical protein [Acidobacteriota bacterium]